VVHAPAKAITLETFLQLPETKPASEFIDGAIIPKPMPQGEHSTLQLDLATGINVVVKPKKIARSYTELRCTFGDRSIVPDISVYQWHRIPRREDGGVANVFTVAPDWTIEILSLGQSQTKVIRNILHCLAHGTQMGWLIDPQERVVFTYSQGQLSGLFDTNDAVLPVPEFAKDFRLTVGELFEWLMA
jgi:Uma2 family endonuclease